MLVATDTAHDPGVTVADVRERTFNLHWVKLAGGANIDYGILGGGDERSADRDTILTLAIAGSDAIADFLRSTLSGLSNTLFARVQPLIGDSVFVEGHLLIFAFLRFLNARDGNAHPI